MVGRCFGDGDPLYEKYHDEEWGVAVHDDRKLFEMLILEGAQAGLSWVTILRRREGYRKVFHNFDPVRVANMKDEELEEALQDKRIIRNRKKVYSARQNGRIFLQIQKEYGSFDRYLWQFVDGQPIVNRGESMATRSELSDAISLDLKKKGMSFVGSVIIYSFLQAVGVIDDHLIDCPVGGRVKV